MEDEDPSLQYDDEGGDNADEGGAGPDPEVQVVGGSGATANADVIARKKAWGRPEETDFSTSPSKEVDNEETITEWKQSLKEDKELQLWPRGWHVVDGPSKRGFYIDQYGVYLLKGDATIDSQTKDDYSYHCIATEACRRRLIMNGASEDNPSFQILAKTKMKTTNELEYTYNSVSSHLLSHRIKSNQAQTAISNAETRREDNENHEAMAGLNNKRYWGIYTVLVYVIGLFNPFTFGSSEKERAYKQRTAQGRFAQAKLYPALVKRYVVELYNYVRSTIGKKLDSAKQGRKLKVFSVNLDLWKSKVSVEKYLGLRLYWIDKQWEFKTCLITVRRFRPSADGLDYKDKASTVLKDWAEQVLIDYGLTWADVFGASSDAGPDVKALFTKVLKMPWEWCRSHLFNVALVEAFGVCLDKGKSKNDACRQMFDDMKHMTQLLNTSDATKAVYDDVSVELWGKSVKPVQAAPQRWTGVIKPTRHLLEKWPAIRASIHAHKNKTEEQYGALHKYTLASQERVDACTRMRGNRLAFMEHYALLQGTQEIIADAQYLDWPAGAHTHMLMIMHRLTTFNKAVPLSVMMYNEDGRQDEATTDLPHEMLQESTRKTRILMAEALDKRGLLKRYGSPAWSNYIDDGVCRMHDVGLMMHPHYADLHYIDTIVDLYSSPRASEATKKDRSTLVKSKIKHQFYKLLVDVLKNGDLDGDATAGGGSTGGGAAGAAADGAAADGLQAPPTVGGKRKSTQVTITEAKGKKGMEEARRLGNLFKKPAAQQQSMAVESNVEVRARELMEDYIQKVDEGKVGVRYTIRNTITYWKEIGAVLFPQVAEVAKSVLAFPGGSGNLERDFCKSGNLITPQRASMDYRYAEMILTVEAFERETKGIPLHQVEELKESELHKYIPARIKQNAIYDRLQAALDAEDGVDDDENDPLDDMARIMEGLTGFYSEDTYTDEELAAIYGEFLQEGQPDSSSSAGIMG